uniref:Putative salivary secreted peptide n=1 Tax=Ixodes ricinus TaxID=34613 RepID=A0A6B0UY12_IXORI
MDIRRMLAYFLFSFLLVLTEAQKSSGPATPKAPKILKKATSLKTPGIQAKQAVPNNTPAALPPAAPSTDPEICAMESKIAGSGLPSLECTLKELPEDILTKWNNPVTKSKKKSSDILKEICEAGTRNEDPDFIRTLSDNEKAMVNDTSVLCRIRQTTPSECTLPLLDA